jgi:hypothetical protein
MSLEEIRGFCSERGIPYRIVAESADGTVKPWIRMGVGGPEHPQAEPDRGLAASSSGYRAFVPPLLPWRRSADSRERQVSLDACRRPDITE